MQSLYPLRFQPTFRQYIWGGRRLGDVLKKPIGQGDDYAESWEVVDHGKDQSIVAAGPLEGMSLSQLITEYDDQLTGVAGLSACPLLFKLLDCNRNLSVQVHPTDSQAAKLEPPDLGKTEAWVILNAEPGSRLYAGLKKDVDQEKLAAAIATGNVESCLHVIEPTAGDCVFIPAGTTHALGAGLLVAEIQQSSDTTYRVFDWNRVGADGKPRQLHIEESLRTIDYETGPVAPQTPSPTERSHVERLVQCDKFVLDRWSFDKAEAVGADGRFHIICVLSGKVAVAGDAATSPLSTGQTAFIPAACGEVVLTPAEPSTLLDMYLPAA